MTERFTFLIEAVETPAGHVGTLHRIATVSNPHGEWVRYSDVAARIEVLRQALQKIESGTFDGVVNMVLSGQWKLMVEAVQGIARAALTDAGKP